MPQLWFTIIILLFVLSSSNKSTKLELNEIHFERSMFIDYHFDPKYHS